MSITLFSNRRELIEDVRLVRRAIREGWAVPQATRDEVAQAVSGIIGDDETPDRKKLGAINLATEMIADNTRELKDAIRQAKIAAGIPVKRGPGKRKRKW